MSYEDETTDILVHDPKSRDGTKWLTPADRLDRVIEIVLDGGTRKDVARKLRIPYDIARELYDTAFQESWGRVANKLGLDVLAAKKQDNVEELDQSIQVCHEDIERDAKLKRANSKIINAKTAAIKVQNAMLGFNAPTQIETTDRKVYALLNPEIHARVMADPKARAALLALEEFASEEAEGEVVIDVGSEGGDPS